MVLYAYMCVFVHSRFIENPLILSWETNPSFLRWFYHNYYHHPTSLHQPNDQGRDPWSEAKQVHQLQIKKGQRKQ
jgi:hypothetical protein